MARFTHRQQQAPSTQTCTSLNCAGEPAIRSRRHQQSPHQLLNLHRLPLATLALLCVAAFPLHGQASTQEKAQPTGAATGAAINTAALDALSQSVAGSSISATTSTGAAGTEASKATETVKATAPQSTDTQPAAPQPRPTLPNPLTEDTATQQAAQEKPAASAQPATTVQTAATEQAAPAQTTATATPAAASAQPLQPDSNTLLSADWGGLGTGARKPKPMPESQTVADQRLQRIYDSQQQVFAEIADNPTLTEAARAQRLQNIISNYQSLLLDNPEYVYGYIMYGKFLRQVDQRQLANMAFVKANALNPDLAVVKQQIANYLSEEGEYDLALPYYLAAIRLEPQTALYHYQLGTLLHTYRKEFQVDGKLTADVLDRQLQDAFAAATRLEPQSRLYAMRYAESFFDVAGADWSAALPLWQALETTAEDEQQRQIILLQKARVLIALGEKAQAQAAIDAVNDPVLHGAKIVVQEQLSQPQPKSPAQPAETETTAPATPAAPVSQEAAAPKAG